jgi:hypothetical protein
MLKQLFFFIVLTFVSYSSEANPCFDSSKKGAAECSAFEYDNLTMYFKDASDLEHKVQVKRVIQKSNRVMVHADYNFVATCNSQCGAINTKVNDMLWAFRNTNINNTFYEKIVYICNPLEEVCCDDTGCTEIQNVGGSPEASADLTEAADLDIEGNVAKLSKKGPKNGDKIDRAIDRLEGITNIVDNVLRNTSNGQQVQTDMAQVAVQSMQFQIVNSTTGGVMVCVSTGSYCNEISGSATASNDMAYFDLEHSYGQAFNDRLRDFLDMTYKSDNGMICSQSTSCDSSNNCEVNMTCRKY